MEIEFGSFEGQYTPLVITAVVLLVLVGLGWIGSSVSTTGADGRAAVLTWTEYRVSQAEKAYRTEREQLRSAVDGLAQLLDKNASPVEAQIHTTRIEDSLGDGLPELADARAAVQFAAQAVRDCSLGKIPPADAADAIDYAASLLTEDQPK